MQQCMPRKLYNRKLHIAAQSLPTSLSCTLVEGDSLLAPLLAIVARAFCVLRRVVASCRWCYMLGPV
jgi:hypothetical protein